MHFVLSDLSQRPAVADDGGIILGWSRFNVVVLWEWILVIGGTIVMAVAGIL